MGFRINLIMAFVLLSSLAYALPGSGTAPDPYLIGNCSDLYSVNTDNLTAYYMLDNNIDCSGFDFRLNTSIIGSFSGDFNGNDKYITGVKLRRFQGQYFGLFGSFNGSAYDFVLDSWKVGGFNNESGFLSQNCGLLVGRTLNGNSLLYNIGVKNSVLSCGLSEGFFVGFRQGGSLNINNVYVKDSRLDSWATTSGQQAGIIGIGIRPTYLNYIISDITHNHSLGGDKVAIVQDSNSITSFNTVWSNISSISATRIGTINNTEIDNQTLFNPGSNVWDNFSNQWLFSTDSKPKFNWENENRTFLTYNINNSFCNQSPGGNYYRSNFYNLSLSGFTYKYICAEDIFNSLFFSATQSENYIFCFNTETAVYNFSGDYHTGVLDWVAPATPLKNMLYNWTNTPLMDTSGFSSYGFSVLNDYLNTTYSRVDINQTFNGSHYNIYTNLISRCDGSFYNAQALRCSSPNSIFYDSDRSSYEKTLCHAWFNENITLSSPGNISRGAVYLTVNNTIDCLGNNLYVDSVTGLRDDHNNMNYFNLQNCYFSGDTGGSNTISINEETHKPLTLNILNNNFNDGLFYYYNYAGILNLHNNKGRMFPFGSVNTSYFNMTYNDLSIPQNYNFETSILYWYKNNLSAPQRNGLFRPLSVDRAYIGYNNFRNFGNISCFGDCDADPEIYNTSSGYNNYGFIDFQYSDNMIIEYNHFENITQIMRLRNFCNNNTIRYNTFLDVQYCLYLRDSSTDNYIYGNNISWTNQTNFGYEKIGSYVRGGSNNNYYYNNKIEGWGLYGIYGNIASNNIFESNYINLSSTPGWVSIFGFSEPIGINAVNLDNSTFYDNIVSTKADYTVKNDLNSYYNNYTENNFYGGDVYTDPVAVGNTFFCNKYLDNASLINANDNCTLWFNDTTPPVCYGLDNVTQNYNTTYNFNYSCSDDTLLDNFTLSCSYGLYYENLSIFAQNYIYLGNTTLLNNFSCNITVYDNSSNGFRAFQTVGGLIPPAPLLMPPLIKEFDNTAQALTIIFFWFFWLILGVLTLILSGKNGETIQLLNLFQLILAFFTMLLTFNISIWLGIVLMFISIGLFFGKLYD